jgi:stage II sporulation protein D
MKSAFRTLAAVFAVCAAVGVQTTGQVPVPQDPPGQSEHEQLEEEYIRTRAEQGESHASGGRPELGPVILGNPTSAVKILRVGLYANVGATEFGTLHHTAVDLTNTEGDVKVTDQSTGKEILVMTPGSLVRVTHDGMFYVVTQDGMPVGTYDGPVLFRPTSRANLFQIENLRRTFSGSKVPLYRGAVEIARGPVTASQPTPRVNLVNIVEVEDYVPGVVANESIASFHVEALKAQAVAARGYAVANIGNYVARGYPFDIVDSSSSQVYRGVISEHVNAVRAASETRGLVASHNGRIIGALYSSSFGGHSEDSEWIFTSAPPSTAVTPYLRGIYDGDGIAPNFTDETGIDLFWKTQVQPDLFDDCSRQTPRNSFSRWRIVLPAQTIKERLGAAVRISGTNAGVITNVEVISRMAASARIAIARITLTTGLYEVRGWDNLRAVLGRTAVSSPRPCGGSTAANFTLNNPGALEILKNPDGTVREVVSYGGGWGHNLGMSQYGSNGRGHVGQTFIQILQAYYTGVDIGSIPIDIGRQPGTGAPTLRQAFIAPTGQGTLQIRSQDLRGLRVHINDLHDLSFDAATLSDPFVEVDISAYLVPGSNVIQYNPVGPNGRATVSAVVR